MNNAQILLAILGQALGKKSRNFYIEYKDLAGMYCHQEATVFEPNKQLSDIKMARRLMEDLDIDAHLIIELFDGYGHNELEAMSYYNPKEAGKHMKLLYADPEYLAKEFANERN